MAIQNPQLMIQSTPNPNALKFVLNTPVKNSGKVTYKRDANFEYNPLAKSIFDIHPDIAEVYFFDNYITVTQNGNAEWDDLEEKIKTAVLANIQNHNPDFVVEEPKKQTVTTVSDKPEISQINTILDETVRPALQMDGGDIQVVDYVDNTVKVYYHGACGSCPSSSMGTMKAIENILRDQFNPDVVVELAQTAE